MRRESTFKSLSAPAPDTKDDRRTMIWPFPIEGSVSYWTIVRISWFMGLVIMFILVGAKLTAQAEETNRSKGRVEQDLSDGPINTMMNNNMVFLGSRISPVENSQSQENEYATSTQQTASSPTMERPEPLEFM